MNKKERIRERAYNEAVKARRIYEKIKQQMVMLDDREVSIRIVNEAFDKGIINSEEMKIALRNPNQRF